MIEKKVLVMGICILLSILIASAEENLTLNETILNTTAIENLTENLTLNDTAQNTTILFPENTTAVNLTLINDTLSDLLENFTSQQEINNTGSYCYTNQDSMDYNKTINGTLIPITLNLSISICYNETTVYCYAEQPSVSPTLFRIDIGSYNCHSGSCDGTVVSNPYDLQNHTINETTSFICLGKIRQEGYFLWLWQSAVPYDEGNVFYFDFSNSTFNSYEYSVTNTTIINITNNITNNIVNNITNNFTYMFDITNNISMNLSGLETRVAVLETWRIGVDSTLDYLIDIVYKIAKFLEKNIFLIDFSGSHFIENNYNVTNETVYNITNNITNDIINNETNNFNYVYNITNNISAENFTELEERVSVLETWKQQVIQTLDYLVQKFNELFAKLEEMLGGK
jgi:hypothetical protein